MGLILFELLGAIVVVGSCLLGVYHAVLWIKRRRDPQPQQDEGSAADGRT